MGVACCGDGLAGCALATSDGALLRWIVMTFWVCASSYLRNQSGGRLRPLTAPPSKKKSEPDQPSWLVALYDARVCEYGLGWPVKRGYLSAELVHEFVCGWRAMPAMQTAIHSLITNLLSFISQAGADELARPVQASLGCAMQEGPLKDSCTARFVLY